MNSLINWFRCRIFRWPLNCQWWQHFWVVNFECSLLVCVLVLGYVHGRLRRTEEEEEEEEYIIYIYIYLLHICIWVYVYILYIYIFLFIYRGRYQGRPDPHLEWRDDRRGLGAVLQADSAHLQHLQEQQHEPRSS